MKPQYESVEKQMMGEQEVWVVKGIELNDDGTPSGTRLMYHFPTDTMEWRAAEYGIDDRNTLLDIVIAEFNMTAEDRAEGVFLYDTEDQERIKADHVARCSKAKLRRRISTRGKSNILNQIRDESPIHPEILEMKRKTVKHTRVQHMAKKAREARKVSPESAEEQRLAMWRRSQPLLDMQEMEAERARKYGDIDD